MGCEKPKLFLREPLVGQNQSFGGLDQESNPLDFPILGTQNFEQAPMALSQDLGSFLVIPSRKQALSKDRLGLGDRQIGHHHLAPKHRHCSSCKAFAAE